MRIYDDEDVFVFLKSRDQKLTLDDLVELREQSIIEEAEEPEP
jgi:hypothetical protein